LDAQPYAQLANSAPNKPFSITALPGGSSELGTHAWAARTDKHGKFLEGTNS